MNLLNLVEAPEEEEEEEEKINLNTVNFNVFSFQSPLWGYLKNKTE